MLKAIKGGKTSTEQKKIRVSYNNEMCYKCNKSDNLRAITNDGGSVSYCKNCNINVVLFEYIDEKDYDEIVENSPILSRMFNTTAFKRENAYYSTR